MEIKTVAILGAGAVGSYVIEGISGCSEIHLGVIAEGERNARLKSVGCTINGVTYHPEVWTSQEADNIDLLIVSLKDGALPTALDTIKQATSQDTIVMSLMNGVDSEEIISTKIDKSHIIYSLIKVASHREGKEYVFNPQTTIGIIYGEETAPFESERVAAIRDLFYGTGLNYRVTEYIKEEIWSKYRLNICNNLPQAIIGAGVGCYTDSEHMKAISKGLRKEVEAVALAKGIDMSRCADNSSRGSAVPPTARYSTLQDIDAGRHTEIDMFSGAMMRMGKELGIDTPYNEYTYHIIKALEEKNDGMFDYDENSEAVTYSK